MTMTSIRTMSMFDTSIFVNGTLQNQSTRLTVATVTDSEHDHIPGYLYVFYGTYVTIILVMGLFQNAVTLSVFLYEKRLWKGHNYFIIGLACADIGMCVLGNWMIIVSAYYRSWVFHREGCVYYGFATTLLGITQISLLASISFDRYVIIVKPRGLVLTSKYAARMVCACYSHGFLWAILPIIGWSSYQLEGINIRCAINWQSQNDIDLSFSLSILLLAWVLPLTVILFSYGSMFSVIRREKNKPFRRLMNATTKGRKRQRREKKMAITVLLMIGAFFISWTPYSIVTLIVAFGKVSVSPHVSMIPALIAKTSIIWNPIIYVARHSEFRQATIWGGKAGHCVERMLGRNIRFRTEKVVHLALSLPSDNERPDVLSDSEKISSECRVTKFAGSTTSDINTPRILLRHENSTSDFKQNIDTLKRKRISKSIQTST